MNVSFIVRYDPKRMVRAISTSQITRLFVELCCTFRAFRFEGGATLPEGAPTCAEGALTSSWG